MWVPAEVVSAGLDVAPEAARLHGLNAVLLHRAGQLEMSEEAYTAALQLDPSLGLVWANRAALAFDRGRLAEASHHLDRAIGLLGPQPDLLANRALIDEDRQTARLALAVATPCTLTAIDLNRGESTAAHRRRSTASGPLLRTLSQLGGPVPAAGPSAPRFSWL